LIGTVFIPGVGLALLFGCSIGGRATPLSLGVTQELAVAGSTTLRSVHAAISDNAAADTDLRSIIGAAVVDAARRTGLNASTLQVIGSEAVTWPDGSLGCPEPGVMYTKAPVPGFRVRIQAGDTVLDYHASQRGYLVHCPSERATRGNISRLGLPRPGVPADSGINFGARDCNEHSAG
jgi:hypothetical protein